MTNRLRVVFAGTPPFAATALERLHAAGFDVVAAMSQPDRPSGRGLKLQPTPVKAVALAHGIPVLQPRGLKLDGKYAADAAAARAELERLAPDVMVVAAYGLILPAWVLALPRHGGLNIHGSLLPRWRGAAPVQRAIEAGDTETGVTWMQMDTGLDTGAMLLTRATPIGPGDTAATLTERLAGIGADLAVEGLTRLEQGDPPPPEPQPEAGVTYAAKIDKAEAAIDWHLPAEVIERRLRAFDPFPGARARMGDEVIACWRGALREGAGSDAAPGTVLAVEPDAVVVACGRGALALTELQRPGGKRLPARAFLQGRAVQPGDRFAAAGSD